jgi:hypothetical protein
VVRVWLAGATTGRWHRNGRRPPLSGAAPVLAWIGGAVLETGPEQETALKDNVSVLWMDHITFKACRR